MTIYVDIDDTICSTPKMPDGNPDYENSKPMFQRIAKVNKLYKDGHIIIFWTARGTMSGEDLHNLTKSQLETWGAKYHKLILGKPYYDLFIDDKNLNASILDGDMSEYLNK